MLVSVMVYRLSFKKFMNKFQVTWSALALKNKTRFYFVSYNLMINMQKSQSFSSNKLALDFDANKTDLQYVRNVSFTDNR